MYIYALSLTLNKNVIFKGTSTSQELNGISALIAW